MPYKAQKYKIEDESLDRRKKLTKRNKLEIIALSNKAGLSQRALARMYNVSRRTIQFVIDPDKLKQNLKRREERGGWKQYYDKDEWKETMKEHRHYKHDLYKKNLIGPKNRTTGSSDGSSIKNE